MVAFSTAMLGVACLTFMMIWPAAAQADGPATELGLFPSQPPGFVQLQACTIEVTIQCGEGGCRARSDHIYRLYNRDRIKPSILYLSAAPAGEIWQGIELRDGAGHVLPKRSVESDVGPTWEMTLAPDERRTLFFTHEYLLSNGLFTRWQWDMTPLAPWDVIDSVRIKISLPQFMPEDALLWVEPQNYAFNGREIIWDYENLSLYPFHKVAALTPQIWQQMSEWQREGRHLELGRLYQELYRVAQAEGIPMSDPFERTLAEFLAAVEADPAAIEPRLELATLYRARADAAGSESGSVGLNYLILSAEQLQAVLGLQPGRSEVAERLAQTYYDAALRARRLGDTAGGLAYLRKAENVPGITSLPAEISSLDLSLQWALDIAEKGMVSLALSQLADALTPELQDAFLRYAPPFTAARTEVVVGPRERRVSCAFTPYPPVSDRTYTRLQELADAWRTIEGVTVAVTQTMSSGPRILVAVTARYATEEELHRLSDAMQRAIVGDRDLLATLMILPWQKGAGAARWEQTPWSERYRYHERVDLVPAAQVWEHESRYAEWRLVELQSGQPTSERERLEQRLAFLALREQRQVWQRLPSATYWVYRLEWEPSAGEKNKAWMLSWGQAQDLMVEVVRFRWPFLLRSIGLLAFILLVLAIVVGRRNKRPARAL
ncbi:MAG: hypothetical protein H5T69_02650 [Chloroflexi bacterium]|nr:hypothetical protein [Chloroflexota bacterium]